MRHPTSRAGHRPATRVAVLPTRPMYPAQRSYAPRAAPWREWKRRGRAARRSRQMPDERSSHRWRYGEIRELRHAVRLRPEANLAGDRGLERVVEQMLTVEK